MSHIVRIYSQLEPDKLIDAFVNLSADEACRRVMEASHAGHYCRIYGPVPEETGDAEISPGESA